ncbi:hypothetical protein Glove_23g266 [Diversispora epigaea]|uniref:Uncharacterized protein n=1 Tax=Diversispora epigaea TaxID=1348612 RepID=A0A397JIW2_9GLOM|nr:hypothetical protein Glove_23g266 [Diversispora epigaea]
MEIDQLVNSEIVMQYDDTLTMYAVDIFTALEEQDQVIVTDIHGTNGQRMNAYKKLGDYLQDTQLESTVTVLKRELHERFHQNGAQIYQIATSGNFLYLLEIGVGSQELPFEEGNICGEKLGDYLQDTQLESTVTVLKRELHERFHQNGAQIYQIATSGNFLYLLEIGVGSQELPFEEGNICGEDEEDEGYCARIKDDAQRMKYEVQR